MAHSIEPLTLVHKYGAGIKITGPNREFMVLFSFYENCLSIHIHSVGL